MYRLEEVTQLKAAVIERMRWLILRRIFRSDSAQCAYILPNLLALSSGAYVAALGED